MPLTDSGKKVRRAMHEEYGEERGDRIFYSKENKDKKFKKLVTGKKKSKKSNDIWWARRIAKLSEAKKSKLLELFKSNPDLVWWVNRLTAKAKRENRLAKGGHTR